MPNDLKALSRDLRRTKQAITEGANLATLRVAIAVRTEAVNRSSGTKTAADRRRADYPYARRHGSPMWDPSTINVGRGLFRASWAVISTNGPDGIVTRKVENRAKVSEYLERGTRQMFARPLEALLKRTAEEAWDRVAPAIFENALNNALQR